jgi:ACS family hexuronate transporter-like MFS transporter
MTEPRWRIALLLSAAIAISYLDRQALSVAVAAIQRDIPLTNVQFSHLQVAFLLALRADVRRRRRPRRTRSGRGGGCWRS